jgi:sigma-B regulation protein RsbU (phosphoserine phosphatase)
MFHGQFVTLQVLVIDPTNNRLEIANAGHPPPLACEGDGSAARPLTVEPQLVLGIQPDVPYPTQQFDLSPGSALLLYTDGVIDAVAEDGARFDAERLAASLAGGCDSAASLLQGVVNTLNAFRGERELVDDLTLVAVALQPSGADAAERQAAVMA